MFTVQPELRLEEPGGQYEIEARTNFRLECHAEFFPVDIIAFLRVQGPSMYKLFYEYEHLCYLQNVFQILFQ